MKLIATIAIVSLFVMGDVSASHPKEFAAALQDEEEIAFTSVLRQEDGPSTAARPLAVLPAQSWWDVLGPDEGTWTFAFWLLIYCQFSPQKYGRLR